MLSCGLFCNAEILSLEFLFYSALLLTKAAIHLTAAFLPVLAEDRFDFSPPSF